MVSLYRYAPALTSLDGAADAAARAAHCTGAGVALDSTPLLGAGLPLRPRSGSGSAPGWLTSAGVGAAAVPDYLAAAVSYIAAVGDLLAASDVTVGLCTLNQVDP
jgi:hypothetical protein